MKAYGGVRVIKKGAVNVVLIIKFIRCHYHIQRHLGYSPYHQLYQTQHLLILQIGGTSDFCPRNRILEYEELSTNPLQKGCFVRNRVHAVRFVVEVYGLFIVAH